MCLIQKVTPYLLLNLKKTRFFYFFVKKKNLQSRGRFWYFLEMSKSAQNGQKGSSCTGTSEGIFFSKKSVFLDFLQSVKKWLFLTGYLLLNFKKRPKKTLFFHFYFLCKKKCVFSFFFTKKRLFFGLPTLRLFWPKIKRGVFFWVKKRALDMRPKWPKSDLFWFLPKTMGVTFWSKSQKKGLSWLGIFDFLAKKAIKKGRFGGKKNTFFLSLFFTFLGVSCMVFFGLFWKIKKKTVQDTLIFGDFLSFFWVLSSVQLLTKVKNP